MLYWLILAIVIFEFALSLSLTHLNIKASRKQIPSLLSDMYDESAYNRQQDYFRQKSQFGVINEIVGTGILLILFACGLFATFNQWANMAASSPVVVSLCFFAIIFLTSWIPSIPFDIYNTFSIEQRFGFNKTTPKTFFSDSLKELLITAILGGGIIALLAWLYQIMQQNFWFVAWASVTAISIFMQFFYSDLIVPLFNKQTPLPEGELRKSIEDFSRICDFKIKDIYVIDGSKRSSHANAYFTGFGSRKRIVLYDTLIEQLSTDEIVAVLSHEIGHYKHNHLIKSMIMSLTVNLVIFYLFGLTINNTQIAQAAGCSEPSFHLNLVVFSLLLTPLNLVLNIISNIISRKHEWQADEFAKQHGTNFHLAAALKAISKQSLSNLTPHPAYAFFHYSHPTLHSRIKHLTEH